MKASFKFVKNHLTQVISESTTVFTLGKLSIDHNESTATNGDLTKSEDKSHDSAYNAIITNYYTTDPFFGVNSGKYSLIQA